MLMCIKYVTHVTDVLNKVQMYLNKIHWHIDTLTAPSLHCEQSM